MVNPALGYLHLSFVGRIIGDFSNKYTGIQPRRQLPESPMSSNSCPGRRVRYRLISLAKTTLQPQRPQPTRVDSTFSRERFEIMIRLKRTLDLSPFFIAAFAALVYALELAPGRIANTGRRRPLQFHDVRGLPGRPELARPENNRERDPDERERDPGEDVRGRDRARAERHQQNNDEPLWEPAEDAGAQASKGVIIVRRGLKSGGSRPKQDENSRRSGRGRLQSRRSAAGRSAELRLNPCWRSSESSLVREETSLFAVFPPDPTRKTWLWPNS